MKYCVIMNQNSYPGREYVRALENLSHPFDVISIGSFPEVSSIEQERCGSLWAPPVLDLNSKKYRVYSFDKLKSEALVKHLGFLNYNFAIQGGTGILQTNLIEKFEYGILNFHPGKLPEYRGCSAPEWQLFEGQPIVSTCHLIDRKIDTGMVLDEKTLDVSYESYENFRASIYPETAIFVAEVVQKILSEPSFPYIPKGQDESRAIYRPFIGVERIEQLKKSSSLM